VELDRYLQDSAAKSPQPEVHVRPNRLAKYDAVAKTLARAQRLGLTKMGFVGNEQYIE
jgi:biopolymer transport protein ExbD